MRPEALSSGRNRFRGALPKPNCIRRAGGGRRGEKAGRDGKWLEWRELEKSRKLAKFVNGVGEGGELAEAGRFPRAERVGGSAGACRWAALGVLAGSRALRGLAGRRQRVWGTRSADGLALAVQRFLGVVRAVGERPHPRFDVQTDYAILFQPDEPCDTLQVALYGQPLNSSI
jgi:hypothetical protein